jgi:heat shock protein HslJ
MTVFLFSSLGEVRNMKSVMGWLAVGVTTVGVWQATLPAIARPLFPSTTIAQATEALQGNWTLVGWGDPETLTPPLPDTEITAQFEGDRLGGSTGCNNYVTTYTAMAGELSLNEVATTLRLCSDPIDEQEQAFLAALSGVDRYSVAGDRLVLDYATEDMSGVLVFERPAAIPGLW